MDVTGFYERVKKLAKANKMTIETAAGQAGLSLASYNAYRRHENLPRADEAQKIAAALGTTVEYLVTGKDPTRPDTAKALKHLEAVQDFLNNL
jgi:transcriptional regulator with XRE-family HTH domain